MINISSIIELIKHLSGHDLYPDEGVSYGDINCEIIGLTVCWMPSPDAIQFTADRKNNILLHHEILQFKSSISKPEDKNYLSWPVNTHRKILLANNNVTAFRLHGSLDEICIYKAFVKQLDLPIIKNRRFNLPYIEIYKITPMTYAELIEKIRIIFNLPHIRYSKSDMHRIIRTIAVPWGGMALSVNFRYLQNLVSCGKIDAMIAGETDSYTFHFCKEQGIDIIETSHEISENDGLRAFCQILNQEWPELKIDFFENR